MHLARRAYLLVFLTALLAVAGIWSPPGEYRGLWRVPLALLLLGLAAEGLALRRLQLGVRLAAAGRRFLGRPQPSALLLSNPASRPLLVEYLPLLPAGFEPLGGPRRVSVPAGATVEDPLVLTPVRLGPQRWAALPARVLGALRLAWWSRELAPEGAVVIAPDTLGARAPTRGLPAGARSRRIAGAGAELYQLRRYVRGDPLPRIDWKATARTGTLITREYSEDQHLDVLVAIDAGRFSRVRAGALDRFGLYANLAARFAEAATGNDDRIGLVVYADRVLASCPPARGLAGVTRLRSALEALSVQAAESDPLTAAIRIRSLLKHRGLIVLLTDLDDASIADRLARAVRLLSPPHLAVVAGVRNEEIAALAQRPAHLWQDPWVALAAAEHEARAALQRSLLRRLGAPVVSAPQELLERAVFAEYEALRHLRRV
ncbi:MAG TPA: DUF58 domain-containing protein [Steroidobacteraceae bacterium]|nr:DUF58 domain-containing protein [Steroidobacteraceae bacterium]